MTQLVDKNNDVVINLQGYTVNGYMLTANINSLPTVGTLYQLSDNYNSFGYAPIRGMQITGPTVVTGSNMRVVYSAPNNIPSNSKWGSFTYTVTDGNTVSNIGTVVLIPSTNNNVVVSSTFDNDVDGWSISGENGKEYVFFCFRLNVATLLCT